MRPTIDDLPVGREELKIAATFLLISCLFAQWAYVNGNSRLNLTRSIVQDGSLDVSAYSNNTLDKVEYRNRTFTDKAPGSSFLAVPLYLAFTHLKEPIPPLWDTDTDYLSSQEADPVVENPTSSFIAVDLSSDVLLLRFLVIALLSALPATITLLLVRRLLRHRGFSARWSTGVALLMGLGTIVLYYSTTFLGNTLAMLTGFAAFYILEAYDGTRRNIASAGILAGFTAVIEYYALLIPAFLFAYLFFRDRAESRLFGITALVGFSPYFIYNVLTVRNPLLPPLIFQETVPASASAILQDALAGAVIGIRLPGFTLSPLYLVQQLFRITLSPSRGLFWYAPVLLIAIPGLYYLYREDRGLGMFIGGMSAAFFVFNASYVVWYGGPYLGPRYLVPLLPFLALPLAYGLRRLWRNPPYRAIIAALVLVSVYTAFLGFNGTTLHPTDVDGENVSSAATATSTAIEQVTGVEVYLNPLPSYRAAMAATGPTSPLLHLVRGPPDMNLNHRFTAPDDIMISAVPGGYLTVEGAGAESVLLLLVVLLIWGPGLLRDAGMTRRMRLALVLGLVTAAVLSLVSVQPAAPGSGWYAANSSNPTTAGFMAENATYHVHADEGDDVIALDIEPAAVTSAPHILSVDVDGEHRTLRMDGRQQVLIPATPGHHQLRLHAVTGCVRPITLETNSSDLRCISFRLHDISSLAFGTAESARTWFGSNWYGNGTERWMSQNATINTYTARPRILSLDVTPSLLNTTARRLIITDGGDVVRNVTLSAPSRLDLRVDPGFQQLHLRTTGSCTVPAEISTDFNDTRCLSLKVRNSSITESDELEGQGAWFGSNWYGTGNERWMSQNATLNTYLEEPRVLRLDIDPSLLNTTVRRLILTTGETTVRNITISAPSSHLGVRINEGFNQLHLRAADGCIVPSRTSPGANDTRCLSFRIDPALISFNRSQGPEIALGQNWYPWQPDADGDISAWMENNATLFLLSGTNQTVNVTMTVESIDMFLPEQAGRTITLHHRGKQINASTVAPWTRIKQSLRLRSGVNTLRFRSPQGCVVLAERLPSSSEKRCMSFHLRNISVSGERRE